jgi:hypothetical protein
MKTTILALATAAAVLTPLVAQGQSKDSRRRVRPAPTDLAWLTFARYARVRDFDAGEKKKLSSLLRGPGFRGLGEVPGYEVVVFDPKQAKPGEILRRLAAFGRVDDYKPGSDATLIDGTSIEPFDFGVDLVCGSGRVVACGHVIDYRGGSDEVKRLRKERLFMQLCIGLSEVRAVLGEDGERQRGDVLRGKIVDVRTAGGLKGHRTGGHDTMADVEFDLDTKPGIYRIDVGVQLEKPAKVVTVGFPVVIGDKPSLEAAVFTPK